MKDKKKQKIKWKGVVFIYAVALKIQRKEHSISVGKIIIFFQSANEILITMIVYN